MKKIDFSVMKSAVKTLIFTLVAFTCSAADVELVDLGTLDPGVSYSIPQFKEIKAVYTPSATGPVKFIWTCNPLPIYTSPNHEENTAVNGSHSYNNGKQIISYASLEGGKTYYLYISMSIMAGELTIQEGDTKIEFVGMSPEVTEEKPYSVSSDYRIYVNFNYPVTIGNSFLIAGGERVQIYPVLSNNSVSCDVYSYVMDFYRRGLIKEGDKMTLRILQIKDALNSSNKYNSNGKLEIEIPMAAKPAELVESRNVDFKGGRNVMNSYYLSGDDASKFVLVFDTEIDAAKTPTADLTYGNADNIELGVYREQLLGEVSGNTVTFDFSGKLRRRIDMLPAATSSELVDDIYASFGGIFTADGQRAYTGVLSNPVGFAASMIVNDLQYNIAADFSPARGSALTPGTEMEIWVMNGSLIQYDNICIDYTSDGTVKTIVIPTEDVTEKLDEDSASGSDMLYYFTIPEFEADPETTVYIYMSNLICADGLDHADDVRGNFKEAISSIAEITAEKSGNDIYDLSGRKVVRPAKGLYIVNGTKTFIR